MVMDPDLEDVFPLFLLQPGIAVWSPSGAFHSTCELNMLAFPFDTQNCTIELISTSYSTHTLHLHNVDDMVDLSLYIESNEYKVVKTYAEQTEFTSTLPVMVSEHCEVKTMKEMMTVMMIEYRGQHKAVLVSS